MKTRGWRRFPPSPLLRVYVQHVPVCRFKNVLVFAATTRTCVETCVRVVPVHTRRFGRTHGDVLNGHKGFVSVSHTAHQTHTHQTHTTTTPQQKTQHNTTWHTTTHHNTLQQKNTTHHTETETERDRDRRQRETEKEDRNRERRGDEREEDKTREERREKIHFQCGGAWPFSVDGVLCLVKPVNARVLSLLNSVKYDSSLISFSAPWQVNFFKCLRIVYFYAVTVFIFLLVMQLQFQNFQNYLVMQLQFFFPKLILHMYSVEG